MADEALQMLGGEHAPAQEELTAEQYDNLTPLMKLATIGNPQAAAKFAAMKPGEVKRRELKQRALDGLREHGTIGHAAAAAGVSVMTIYRWRAADEAFARQVTEFMHVDQVDQLHQSMYNIATNPTDRTANAAVQAGKFLLQSLDRDTYGDHIKQETTTTINHMVQVVHEVRDIHRERQAERLRRLRTLDAEPPPNVKSDILPPSEEITP